MLKELHAREDNLRESLAMLKQFKALYLRGNRAEKLEIVRPVEEHELSANQILRELEGNRNSIYEWYRRYLNK